MRTLLEYQLDGQAVLSALLSESTYGGLLQAVARLSVFAHPDTVIQAQTRGVFSIVRCRASSERGKITQLASGRRAMLDDNKGPTDAFVWAHGWKKKEYTDLQFNHLWSCGDDPDHYTNLANLCVLPAFLSKLSDTHEETKTLLRYRSFDLHGYNPTPTAIKRPANYETLSWSDPLPPVQNLEAKYIEKMRRSPRDRTTQSLYKVGWLFSDFRPVDSV